MLKAENPITVFQFTESVKTKCKDQIVKTAGDREFYGKVSFCFQAGKFTHIEKSETEK